jgi:hypothetical protein
MFFNGIAHSERCLHGDLGPTVAGLFKCGYKNFMSMLDSRPAGKSAQPIPVDLLEFFLAAEGQCQLRRLPSRPSKLGPGDGADQIVTRTQLGSRPQPLQGPIFEMSIAISGGHQEGDTPYKVQSGIVPAHILHQSGQQVVADAPVAGSIFLSRGKLQCLGKIFLMNPGLGFTVEASNRKDGRDVLQKFGVYAVEGIAAANAKIGVDKPVARAQAMVAASTSGSSAKTVPGIFTIHWPN